MSEISAEFGAESDAESDLDNDLRGDFDNDLDDDLADDLGDDSVCLKICFSAAFIKVRGENEEGDELSFFIPSSLHLFTKILFKLSSKGFPVNGFLVLSVSFHSSQICLVSFFDIFPITIIYKNDNKRGLQNRIMIKHMQFHILFR